MNLKYLYTRHVDYTYLNHNIGRLLENKNAKHLSLNWKQNITYKKLKISNTYELEIS